MSLTQCVSTQLALPQGNIAALQNEPKDGQEPVLALHGWLDNAASFIPLIQNIPTVNWTAIDLPGHGASFHRPAHTYYHFIDWVSDLVSLIKMHFKSPIVIVGHSLGGMLATVLAGLYPELVKKLVLIDAAGLVTQEPSEGVQQLRQALDSRQMNTKQSKTFSLPAAVKARMQSGDIAQPSAELLVKRSVIEVEGGWQWRSDKRLYSRSPIRLSEQQAQSIIESIHAPTLMCLASQGYPSIKQNFDKFRHCYQNLIKVDVTGHHHCHMDNPSETALAIRNFITKV